MKLIKNKWLWSVIVLVVSLFMGGKLYADKKNTFKLSEEQQKNIAVRIVRSSEKVYSIEFLESYINSVTGALGVNV